MNELQVGVHELGIRRAILQEVENFLAATKLDVTSEVSCQHMLLIISTINIYCLFIYHCAFASWGYIEFFFFFSALE